MTVSTLCDMFLIFEMYSCLGNSFSELNVVRNARKEEVGQQVAPFDQTG